MSNVVDHVEVEFLMLADRAEFINGKLYMMGGLYNRVQVKDLKNPPSICVVIGVIIPWALTNQEHTITFRVETEDGQLIGKEVQGRITMARPMNSIPGQIFKAVMVPNVKVQFPSYGAYRIVAQAANRVSKQTPLYVMESV